LTRARVSLELIEEGPGRDEIGRDLAEIDRLIAELLETERLNTRHSPLLLAPASINALIRELVERDFPDAALELDLDEELPEIALDTTRIQLMARNLIDNALRHGGQAGVTVSTRREDALLRLGVRDQGPGVDPAHLPHLLEPFYRADAARRRQTGGFGLGLYLCRLITQAHGGNIQIDSRSGQGTEIVVYLPLTRSGPTC